MSWPFSMQVEKGSVRIALPQGIGRVLGSCGWPLLFQPSGRVVMLGCDGFEFPKKIPSKCCLDSLEPAGTDVHVRGA